MVGSRVVTGIHNEEPKDDDFKLDKVEGCHWASRCNPIHCYWFAANKGLVAHAKLSHSLLAFV